MLFIQKVKCSIFFTSLFVINLALAGQTEVINVPEQAIELRQTELIRAELSTKPYKYYDVEVILFKHNNPSAISSEYWETIDEINSTVMEDDTANIDIKTEPLSTNINNKILANYLTNSKQFKSFDNRVSSIEQQQRILNKAADHLRYSKKYQLLAHLAWKQPGFDKNRAQAVKFIFSGKNQNITGQIKIILARYLHTQAAFDLVEEVCRTTELASSDQEKATPVKIEVSPTTAQQTIADSAASPPANQAPEAAIVNKKITSEETICQMEKIQFKQSRKMRSRELHYLDHPVFGLLVEITPSATAAINTSAKILNQPSTTSSITLNAPVKP
ncbi:MAG: CsiV family protein [Pseudomonadota bacterium]